MIRKGIFGGTFDPVHNGHLHIAYEALKFLNLDRIIFMPSGNPPHKVSIDKTDAVLRYEMLLMAVREEKKFEVSKYEIDKKDLSFTFKTMEYFKEMEPEIEWYFITGADCLMDLNYWREIDRIFKACRLVVFSRSGFNEVDLIAQKQSIEKKYDTEILILNLPLLEISSSEIRKKIFRGENANFLMPQSVYNTVIELGLYRENGE